MDNVDGNFSNIVNLRRKILAALPSKQTLEVFWLPQLPESPLQENLPNFSDGYMSEMRAAAKEESNTSHLKNGRSWGYTSPELNKVNARKTLQKMENEWGAGTILNLFPESLSGFC